MNGGSDAFFDVIASGDENAMIRYINSGENIDDTYLDDGENTPFLRVIVEGYGRAAMALIDNNLIGDIEATNSYGLTPLIASCQTELEDVASRLIEMGANINAEDEDGNTPLIFSCDNGLVNLVKILIDKGADVTHANVKRATPLMFSCNLEDAKIADLILSKIKNDNNIYLADYENALLVLEKNDRMNSRDKSRLKETLGATIYRRSSKTGGKRRTHKHSKKARKTRRRHHK
jgi:ankyrin repeat protein